MEIFFKGFLTVNFIINLINSRNKNKNEQFYFLIKMGSLQINYYN